MRYAYLLVTLLATTSLLVGQASRSDASRLQRLKITVDNIIAAWTETDSVERSVQNNEIRTVLTARALAIDAEVAAEQLRILNSSVSIRGQLQSLSSAFRLAHTQDDRNPFIDSFFTVYGRTDMLISSVSTIFPTGAVPDSSVTLHAFELQAPISIVLTTVLEEMENTSARILAIPTDESQQCLVLVHGHDLKKMQYHERAAIYQYDANGLRLLWKSGYLQDPEFSVAKGSVMIKQSVNLVGGDASDLAAAYPEFQGYATRTLTVFAGSVSESAPSLLPPQ